MTRMSANFVRNMKWCERSRRKRPKNTKSTYYKKHRAFCNRARLWRAPRGKWQNMSPYANIYSTAIRTKKKKTSGKKRKAQPVRIRKHSGSYASTQMLRKFVNGKNGRLLAPMRARGSTKTPTRQFKRGPGGSVRESAGWLYDNGAKWGRSTVSGGKVKYLARTSTGRPYLSTKKPNISTGYTR
jgi:hypothetical protein